MHEHFNFASAPLYYRAYIFNRELAGQHHTGKTQFLERQHPFKIVCDKLRGRVYRQGRKMPPQHTGHADVLDYQRIRCGLVKEREPFDGILQFGIGQKRIERNVNLAPFRTGAGHKLGQLGNGKVHGLGTCGKRIQTEIYRIRAGLESGQCRFERSGGR